MKSSTQTQNSGERKADSRGGPETMPTRLLIAERPLTVLPSLVKLVGMERAVILQQVHWLIQQRHNGIIYDGDKWVWGTHEQWCEDYFSFWKAATLRKHMAGLETDGFLCSMQIGGFNRKKHYRIDYEFLDRALQEMECATLHDDGASIEHDRTQCIEHDDTQSIEHDHAASMRDDHAASMRDDHAASIYRTKTSTKTSTESTTEGEGASAPPALAPSLELPSRKASNGKLLYKSPHLDKTHFDPNTGYIAGGRGTTAVEVYYERFDIQHNDQRLTGPMEDDLICNCPDLDKLREVITAYSRAGFKNQRNVQLILDWYQKGIPDKHSGVASPTNGRMSPTDKTEANAAELRAMIKAQGKESILHG